MQGTNNRAQENGEFVQGDANTAQRYSIAQGYKNSAYYKGFSQGQNNSAVSDSIAQGQYNKAIYYSFAQGDYNSASYTGFSQGYTNSSEYASFAQGYENKAGNTAMAQGYRNSANYYGFAGGRQNSAANYSFAHGDSNSAQYEGFAQGVSNSANNYALAQGYQNIATNNAMAQGWNNSADNYSIAQGEKDAAYNYSQAFGHGNIMSANGMAIGSYNKTSAGAAFVIGNGSGSNVSARSDSFIIFKDGSVSAAGNISANGVELGGGGGGASYSAGANIDITDNVISGRDWTDDIASATSGLQPSGDYYSASNPSGFMTELPASATEAIETVTSQSASWGGSALPVSAGPGIKLQLVNDTLVASVTGQYNETVLWSGVWNSSADTIELSEPASAFEHVAVTNNTTYCSRYTYDGKSTCWSWFQPYCSNTGTLFYATRFTIDEDGKTVRYGSCGTSRITTAGVVNFALANMNVGEVQVTKVVGINRISGGN